MASRPPPVNTTNWDYLLDFSDSPLSLHPRPGCSVDTPTYTQIFISYRDAYREFSTNEEAKERARNLGEKLLAIFFYRIDNRRSNPPSQQEVLDLLRPRVCGEFSSKVSIIKGLTLQDSLSARQAFAEMVNIPLILNPSERAIFKTLKINDLAIEALDIDFSLAHRLFQSHLVQEPDTLKALILATATTFLENPLPERKFLSMDIFQAIENPALDFTAEQQLTLLELKLYSCVARNGPIQEIQALRQQIQILLDCSEAQLPPETTLYMRVSLRALEFYAELYPGNLSLLVDFLYTTGHWDHSNIFFSTPQKKLPLAIISPILSTMWRIIQDHASHNRESAAELMKKMLALTIDSYEPMPFQIVDEASSSGIVRVPAKKNLLQSAFPSLREEILTALEPLERRPSSPLQESVTRSLALINEAIEAVESGHRDGMYKTFCMLQKNAYLLWTPSSRERKRFEYWHQITQLYERTLPLSSSSHKRAHKEGELVEGDEPVTEGNNRFSPMSISELSSMIQQLQETRRGPEQGELLLLSYFFRAMAQSREGKWQEAIEDFRSCERVGRDIPIKPHYQRNEILMHHILYLSEIRLMDPARTADIDSEICYLSRKLRDNSLKMPRLQRHPLFAKAIAQGAIALARIYTQTH